jgi:hypothetical protein
MARHTENADRTKGHSCLARTFSSGILMN